MIKIELPAVGLQPSMDKNGIKMNLEYMQKEQYKSKKVLIKLTIKKIEYIDQGAAWNYCPHA